MKLQMHFRTDIWPKRCTAQKRKEEDKGINLTALIKSRQHRNVLPNMTRPNHSSSRTITDTPSDTLPDEEEVMALNSLQFFEVTATSTIQPTRTKIDRAGWGRSLLGPGLDKWMDKGIRSW